MPNVVPPVPILISVIFVIAAAYGRAYVRAYTTAGVLKYWCYKVAIEIGQ